FDARLSGPLYQVLGPEAVVAGYRLQPLGEAAPDLAERLGNGFTITRCATKTSWHFDFYGLLHYRDMRLPGGRGTLRVHATAWAQRCREHLDEQGRPSRKWQPELTADGVVALLPTADTAAPREGEFIDPQDGRLLEETVAIRDGRGRPSGARW